MYLITDDKTTECAVVDPAEPDEVRTRIFSRKISVNSFPSNF
jgi:hypothetical protein